MRSSIYSTSSALVVAMETGMLGMPVNLRACNCDAAFHVVYFKGSLGISRSTVSSQHYGSDVRG